MPRSKGRVGLRASETSGPRTACRLRPAESCAACSRPGIKTAHRRPGKMSRGLPMLIGGRAHGMDAPLRRIRRADGSAEPSPRNDPPGVAADACCVHRLELVNRAMDFPAVAVLSLPGLYAATPIGRRGTSTTGWQVAKSLSREIAPSSTHEDIREAIRSRRGRSECRSPAQLSAVLTGSPR